MQAYVLFFEEAQFLSLLHQLPEPLWQSNNSVPKSEVWRKNLRKGLSVVKFVSFYIHCVLAWKFVFISYFHKRQTFRFENYFHHLGISDILRGIFDLIIVCIFVNLGTLLRTATTFSLTCGWMLVFLNVVHLSLWM